MFAVVLGIGARAAGDPTPVERFLATLDAEEGLPVEARELMRSSWAQCVGCDAEEFLAQALAVLSPEYCEGLGAYEDDDYGRCAEIMHRLRSSLNPFVATGAAAYEAKALVTMERLADAAHIIEQLLADGGADVETYSYFAPELSFLRGYCRLGDLQYDEAETALRAFLTDYPEAPLRFTILARQMLGELANRQPGRIGEVVDLMGYSRRRLNHKDTGQVVQTRQQRIIELLSQLIEEAEQQEKSCSSSSGSDDGKSPQERSPDSPMPESRLPGGTLSEGVLRPNRRANPAEAWGAMPPAQRERILQALRDSFPSSYRKLVEQYYEELAKKP